MDPQIDVIKEQDAMSQTWTMRSQGKANLHDLKQKQLTSADRPAGPDLCCLGVVSVGVNSRSHWSEMLWSGLALDRMPFPKYP